MQNDWKEKISERLKEVISLDEILDLLKYAKSQGVSKEAVIDYLTNLRAENTYDEVGEDRVLEILDVVYGFCNQKYRVW